MAICPSLLREAWGRQTRRSTKIALKSFTNRRHDGLAGRKRPVHQLCYESALAGRHDPTVDDDVELARTALLEFDRET